MTIETAIHAAMMSLQAKKCWAWPAAASTGREAGNRFSPSPKKGTACHHCDARLPEDCEQVGAGCLKSPSSTDCHHSSLEADIHLS